MSTDSDRALPASLRRSDFQVAGLLLVAGFVAAWVGYQLVSPEIGHMSTFDYWFESDVPDVYLAMLDRGADAHWRAQHHPMFPWVTTPPTMLLTRVFGVSGVTAVGVVTATLAGLFVASMFLFLRLATLTLGAALAWTGVAAVSASSVFWLPVPEAYALGALSLVPALMLVARPPGPGWRGFVLCIIASALTFAGSTNNWSLGLLMLVAVLPFKRAVLAGVLSLCLVWVGWRLGTFIIPGAPSFLHLGNAETTYLFSPLGLGVGAKLGVLFAHSMVLPPPEEVLGSYLSPQGLRPGSGGALPLIGVLLWGALFALGIASAVRGAARRLSLVAGLAMLSQAVFYLAFGIETFHYSVQVIPLLVAIAAPAAIGPWRRPALVLALLFVAVAGWNNIARFQDAAHDLGRRYARERAFAERVAQLTDSTRPVLYGARTAAAEAYIKPPLPPRGRPRNVWPLGLFDHVDSRRQGWEVFFDHWSVDLIESYRVAGAAYFVTSYSYGLARSPELLAALDARYKRIESTPDWVIYELSAAR